MAESNYNDMGARWHDWRRRLQGHRGCLALSVECRGKIREVIELTKSFQRNALALRMRSVALWEPDSESSSHLLGMVVLYPSPSWMAIHGKRGTRQALMSLMPSLVGSTITLANERAVWVPLDDDTTTEA